MRHLSIVRYELCCTGSSFVHSWGPPREVITKHATSFFVRAVGAACPRKQNQNEFRLVASVFDYTTERVSACDATMDGHQWVVSVLNKITNKR